MTVYYATDSMSKEFGPWTVENTWYLLRQLKRWELESSETLLTNVSVMLGRPNSWKLEQLMHLNQQN